MKVPGKPLRWAEALRRRRADAAWLLAYALAPMLLLGGALALWVAEAEVLRHLRGKVFDSYQRLAPRAYDPDVQVRIVDLDDETLRRKGQWPWPRTMLADMLRRLDAAGAAVVAFDMVFAEPDRTSPAKAAELLPAAPAWRNVRSRLRRLPDNDAVFAKAVSEGNVVMGFSLTSEPNAGRPKLRGQAYFSSGQKEGRAGRTVREQLAGGGELAAEDSRDYLPAGYRGAVASLPALEDAAAGNGCFSIVPDRDGIIRFVPLLYRLGDEVYPALAAEALRLAFGAAAFKVSESSKETAWHWGEGGLSRVGVGSLTIPTDPKGNIVFHDSGYQPARFIPAWTVFEPGFDPALVEGRMLFVGTSAAGLKDMRATPLNQVAAGVEVHAQVVEQALSGNFLRRPEWATAMEFFCVAALGLALILLMPKLGAAWCALLAGGASAAAFGASWRAFTKHGLLVDPVSPFLAVMAIYLATSLINFLRTEAEKRQIRGAFSRYMSPALVEELSRHPEKLKLGGELRELTLHFCDIRGFTTISEQFDPEGLTWFINRFLTPMTQTILDRQGFIDKYMGDCIMAFWNAPLDDPDHAAHACRAALEMHERLGELNFRMEAEAREAGRRFIPIHIGTGLNTGPCCVGNMGSDQRFDYSVLGDDVNLASRLEGQSKTYGVAVVAGPRTRELAPGFAFLELDLIRVKGKTVPVRIFTLLGDSSLAGREEFKALEAAHRRMLEAYRSGDWDPAERLIADCLGALARLRAAVSADAAGALPADAAGAAGAKGAAGAPAAGAGPRALGTLYDLYSHRIEAFRAEPPPADWDGTFTAITK